MKDIIERQREFERLVGFAIDSPLASVRDTLSEIFLFKAIEEIVELRKEMPSTMNAWSKKNHEANKERVLEELSDVLFFLMNFCLSWKLTPEEVLETMKKVQANNFQKVKEKKMALINQEMMALPGYTICVGQGNLMPKYVFIGQNPGKDIVHGYKAWSNPEDGPSAMLLPALQNIGILQDCYFTNLVKATTPDNREPTAEEAEFWTDYLNNELDLLRVGNPTMQVVVMGKWTAENYKGESIKIRHPAYYLRTDEPVKYEREIESALAPLD